MALKTVLVAEAKPTGAAALRQHLIKLGIKNPVIHFTDGIDLMTFLRSTAEPKSGSVRPQLLLLEIDLPKANGLEVLRWIREQSCLRDLPVILLADAIDAREVKRAAALGVREFAAKQAPPAVLAETISKAFRER